VQRAARSRLGDGGADGALRQPEPRAGPPAHRHRQEGQPLPGEELLHGPMRGDLVPRLLLPQPACSHFWLTLIMSLKPCNAVFFW